MVSIYLLSAVVVLGAGDSGAAGPEHRAVAYLAREVPRWAADNKCYSCHNNGDAARALYVASRRSYAAPAAALADNTRWLSRPEGWDKNGGDEALSDKVLAGIQFAAALADAVDAGAVKDRKPLARAAEAVAGRQQKNGSWKVDGGDVTGSPVTYGTCLATQVARRTLQRADPERYRDAIARADRWLRKERVSRVLDAAAILMALDGSDDAEARAQRGRCLDLIRKGHSKEGGWGAYVTSPPEPFDTAIVVLALVPFKDQAEFKPLLQKGRAFLLTGQEKDGSWRETTRPAGAASYAQRLSTTAWATLALLATAPETSPQRKTSP